MPLYVTSDLNLASVLLALGYTMVGMSEKTPTDSRQKFYFPQKVESDANEYWNKRLKVEPQSLFNARKELLSRLHSENEQSS